MQLWKTRLLSKCHPQNFWTQARAAHSQQQDVGKSGSLHIFRDPA